MRMFCKIHQSSYDTKNGCPLWSEHDLEHKAEKDCLPAENHPLYKKAAKARSAVAWNRLTKK